MSSFVDLLRLSLSYVLKDFDIIPKIKSLTGADRRHARGDYIRVRNRTAEQSEEPGCWGDKTNDQNNRKADFNDSSIKGLKY